MGLFYNRIVGDVAIFEGDACGSFVIFHEMFSSYHGAMVAKREGETGVLVNDYVRNFKKAGKVLYPEKLNTTKNSGISFLWYALETGFRAVP